MATQGTRRWRSATGQCPPPRGFWSWAGLLALAWPAGLAAQGLADLSLEELANLEITSVSRRAEKLAAAPASVQVISGEALRRAGVASLGEALRLAPALQVARVDAAAYAISARGFNNAIGNKLLVLVDGRTIYTPFFSGVFWDQQPLMLEDIDRIEVITGPGATLWGANAVNGVINVISKPARETQGTLLSASAGPEQQHLAARFGAGGGSLHWRLYAREQRWQNTHSAAGAALADGLTQQLAGLRADWRAGPDQLVLQTEAAHGHSDPRPLLGALPPQPLQTLNAHLLARWTRQLDDGASLRVQAVLDRSRRADPLLYQPDERLFDLDLQHVRPWGAHQLVVGGGWRRSHDELNPGLFFGFVPARRRLSWTHAFVQDTISLSPRWQATLGLRLEHNDFSGLEQLPSLRLAWQAAPDQFWWAALSRAVRSPARLDRDIRLPPRPPYLIAGGDRFDSEVAKVLELGWRGRLASSLSAQATVFVHHWDRLRSGEPPPNAQVQNMIEGRTHGLEASATWQPLPYWRLSGALTLLRMNLRLAPGSRDPVGPSALGNDPPRQIALRSSLSLGDVDVELAVRRVAALPQPVVPAYTACDLTLAWQPHPSWQLMLVATDLGDPSHPEYGAAPGRSELPRSVRLQARVLF